MKTVGKILLFIGGLLFFIGAILDIVHLVTTCIQSPATFFKTDPLYVGYIALAFAILWILLDLFGGFSGMTYALNGSRRGWVQVLTVVIIVLLVLNLISAITASIQAKSFAWSTWSSVVYGGVAGILYILGYFLDRRRSK